MKISKKMWSITTLWNPQMNSHRMPMSSLHCFWMHLNYSLASSGAYAQHLNWIQGQKKFFLFLFIPWRCFLGFLCSCLWRRIAWHSYCWCSLALRRWFRACLWTRLWQCSAWPFFLCCFPSDLLINLSTHSSSSFQQNRPLKPVLLLVLVVCLDLSFGSTVLVSRCSTSASTRWLCFRSHPVCVRSKESTLVLFHLRSLWFHHPTWHLSEWSSSSKLHSHSQPTCVVSRI